jgi:site-specific recombinase XerC
MCGQIRSLLTAYVNVNSPPYRQAAALDIATLRKTVAALPRNLKGMRDRALLLIGFAAALRPSELIGLDIGERAPGGTGSLDIGSECITITLHSSKSDYFR